MQDDEWLRARDTFHLIIKGTSMGIAESRLREGLRRGRVRARAMDGTLEPRGGQYWIKKTEVQDWDIPAEVWKGDGNNSAFSLTSDRYTSRDSGTGYGSVLLSGLSFHRAELLSYMNIEREQPKDKSADSEPGRGGRRTDPDKWNATLSALIVYAQCVGIDRDDQPGTVLSKALDYAAGLGLSDEAISIDRCRKGILSGKALIGQVEGWEGEG